MIGDGSPADFNTLVHGSSWLDRAALAIGSAVELEELLSLLLGELDSVIPCESLGLFRRDGNGGFLVTAVSRSDTGRIVESGCVPAEPGDSDDIPAAFCSRENSLSTHPVLRRLASCGLASSLCVPVAIPGQSLGMLVASSTRPHSFSHRELPPFLLVAHLVAPTLNGIRLQERLDASQKELLAVRNELARSERLVVQGELASGVAHDINNILGLIAARADLLVLQGLPSQALSSVQSIRQAVDDGMSVVRRMTQFARRQRSQDLVMLDLNRVVEDTLELTKPRWQHGSAARAPTILVRFDPGQVSSVMGVPVELREVMVNLVMNAVDATPPGGEIVIETRQDGPWAVVSVSDTGCGIPEEALRHIFEPFFTTKGEAGSGLGLWVSNGIVARHGGDIQVDTEAGKGSSFRVRLPSARPSIAQLPLNLAVQAKSILIVDDELGLAEALKLSLEMAGHQVVVCGDSRRALDAFRSSVFDLVITDLRMPGMTGWELAAEIKRISPCTPIIAMTGWPVDLVREEQNGSDLEMILQKPLRVNDLRVKVAKLFADRCEDRGS